MVPVDGRRPVYLCALPVFLIGSAGVAAAQSISSLLFWRFFQSMGASIGPVIGAAVIGDIFKLEERGRAMGISFAIGKPINLYPCPTSYPDSDFIKLA
jgi:MFS family permease